MLYISATCSGETIPAGKSNRERIFDVVSCCRSNCFFSSYAEVLDFFDGGSHEDNERFPSETLALDDGKGPDRDEDEVEEGVEENFGSCDFGATTTDFVLGAFGILKFPESSRRTTFAAGGVVEEEDTGVDDEGAAGAPAAAAARATRFAARLLLIFSVCFFARASRAIFRVSFNGAVERVGTAAAPELDDDAVESIIEGVRDGAGIEAGEGVTVGAGDGGRRRVKSDAAIAFDEDEVGRNVGEESGSDCSGPKTATRSSSDGSTSIARGSSKRSATHGSTTSHFFTRRRISFPRKWAFAMNCFSFV